MRIAALALLVGLGATLVQPRSDAAGQDTPPVAIHANAEASRFDVTIGGKPFTSYLYGKEFADKPVFYPVLSPNGARVNREYPMVANLPGETTDHPHHQSMFFAYDEVNGTNFWNTDKSGRKIVPVTSRAHGNVLDATLAWTNKDGQVLFDETKRVSFGGEADVFWMTHDITLTARVPVTMGDTKEGMFAIRLNDTLKEAGGSGRYLNAEGLETAAHTWGKPSMWVAIRGAVKDAAGTHDVTVAIFAHPRGANVPPYWHARDYGLLAANPFGRKAFDPAAPERVTSLAAGQSVQVSYRLAVFAGQVTKARLDAMYQSLGPSSPK